MKIHYKSKGEVIKNYKWYLMSAVERGQYTEKEVEEYGDIKPSTRIFTSHGSTKLHTGFTSDQYRHRN